jgi:hypothetical protein
MLETLSCCIGEKEVERPIGVERLTKDLRDSALKLSAGQARYLVDYYYQMQDDRIRAAAQARSSEEDESVEWIQYVFKHLAALENRIKTALGIYAGGHELGEWSQSITGIGPVISAALLAHIDIAKTPHAGALWRLAGLDPTMEWIGREKAKTLVRDVVGKNKITEEHLAILSEEAGRTPGSLKKMALSPKPGGEKAKNLTKDNLTKALSRRPWNAKLKVVTWKLGESFVKQQNSRGGEFYGGYYSERREIEEAANKSGKNRDQALAKAKTVGRTTEAYKHYSEGMFPPGHIYSRAKRWVVKLFLSHYHHVGYEILNGEPPARPWIITHGGHSDFIPPPNWK